PHSRSTTCLPEEQATYQVRAARYSADVPLPPPRRTSTSGRAAGFDPRARKRTRQYAQANRSSSVRCATARRASSDLTALRRARRWLAACVGGGQGGVYA